MSEMNAFLVKYTCFSCHVSLTVRSFKTYLSKHQPLQLHVQLKTSRQLGWNEIDIELLSKSKPWNFSPPNKAILNGMRHIPTLTRYYQSPIVLSG